MYSVRSSAVFFTVHPTEKTSATISRPRAIRRARSVPSRAASSTGGAKYSANRSTFVPMGEATTYVSTMPAAYTAPLHRATRQARGASTVTARPSTTGGHIRPAGIGCSPSKGNSSVVSPTTAAGGTRSTRARPRSRTNRNPAPTTARNSPATGDAMVASAAYPAASTSRRSRTRNTQAASPKARPSAKVVRPEATLHHRAREASRATHSGLRTPDRMISTAASQAAASPDNAVTVRTPSAAIRYGEMTL